MIWPRQTSIRGYCFAMLLHAIIWGRTGSAVAPFGHFAKAIARQNGQKWSFFSMNFEVLKSCTKNKSNDGLQIFNGLRSILDLMHAKKNLKKFLLLEKKHDFQR